jgi:hypothetical protein
MTEFIEGRITKIEEKTIKGKFGDRNMITVSINGQYISEFKKVGEHLEVKEGDYVAAIYDVNGKYKNITNIVVKEAPKGVEQKTLDSTSSSDEPTPEYWKAKNASITALALLKVAGNLTATNMSKSAEEWKLEAVRDSLQKNMYILDVILSDYVKKKMEN